jgi:hypothetical protein
MNDEERLRILERETLRKIFGPKYEFKLANFIQL